MKLDRKLISEEIQKLMEDKYPMPLEIQNALEVKLKMTPIIRYVDYLKAVNSIPPSYEVNLHNGKKFLIFYEDFSLMVHIEGREYYLMDLEEPEEEEEPADDAGGDTGGGADDVAMEPEEEPAEEPADEEPTV